MVAEMRAVIDEYRDRVLIGEIYLPIKQLVTYYGTDLNGAQLPFNFQLLQCRVERRMRWRRQSPNIRAALPPEHGRIGCWAITTNRASRHASASTKLASPPCSCSPCPARSRSTTARKWACRMSSISTDEVQDPAEKNQPGIGSVAIPNALLCRGNGSVYAGFTTSKPWLPLNTDYRQRNVSTFEADVSSILHLYRRLIALRRSCPVLVSGALLDVSAEGALLRYQRVDEHSRWMVLLNLGDRALQVVAPASTVVISTISAKQGTVVSNLVALDANEGLVLDCRPSLGTDALEQASRK